MKNTELTEEDFWEKYWSGCSLPSLVDPDFSFDRCLSRALREAAAGVSGEVLEIGCAPGRWMAFFQKECGLLPSGIEYTAPGNRITRENLRLLGVPYGKLWEGDFLAIEPEPKFDAVVSLGFIEHFSDPSGVILRHAGWLKPGGRLILGVPNFRGVYGFLQGICDKSVLEKHNLAVMTTDFFRGLDGMGGLRLLNSAYLGSFEPSLPVCPKKNTAAVLLVKALLRALLLARRPAFFDNFNGPSFSSYILSSFMKEGGK